MSSFRDRLASLKNACANCKPGACAGCSVLQGEHCDDCTAHIVGEEPTQQSSGGATGTSAATSPTTRKPPRYRCSKCGAGTTKARAEGTGMCGTCQKVWDRPGFDASLEHLEKTAPQVFRRVRELFMTGLATVKVLAVVRREFGKEAAPGRLWDEGFLLIVDERAKVR